MTLNNQALSTAIIVHGLVRARTRPMELSMKLA